LEVEDLPRRWIEPVPTPILGDAPPGPQSDFRLLI
jgi:hypothetical protein